jgi:excinuclease ABC subunit C
MSETKSPPKQDAATRLAWQLQHLPRQAGVYLMKNSQGTVLYIGKARVLAQRVKSYFQKGKEPSPKTVAMVSQIDSIETMVTGSELEALLLENNLIKQYRPKYNILLRDDKNYPLLRLPIHDDYPRLSIVRRVEKDGALYFGPYSPSNGLYETIRLLRKLFPLPNCTMKIDGTAERPCIEFEIKRCLAPCTGHQSKASYHEMVQQVRLFLEGKDRTLLTQLSKQMEQKANALDFEEAARIRDQIAKVKRALEKQRITAMGEEDRDVIALFKKERSAMLAILFIRNGMVLGKKDFFFEDVGDQTNAEIISTFLRQFHDQGRIVPRKIIVPIALPDQEALTEWLSDQCGHRVHLLSASHGADKKLLELGLENAISSFENRFQRDSLKAGQAEPSLAETQALLHLSRLPLRIEGYDISNIMGTSAVGSMVVFKEGLPHTDDYRHFKIKTIDQANDFGMMAEMLERRVRGLKEKGDLPPDLILIDGGKGQLSAVREVLDRAGLGSIDLIGLAKEKDGKPERIYRPDLAEPILLPIGAPSTHLLMRIRDEAHRFAVSFHRKIRSQRMLSSPLSEIEGIGKVRRLTLLRHFGSIDKIRASSVEEIEKLPGFNKKASLQLWKGLATPGNPVDPLNRLKEQ